ncbi:MAG: hypothetical protein JF588_08240 [Caulobacterales bacterium]|nr:hypothetical protein [Caulobacterales bacterium]
MPIEKVQDDTILQLGSMPEGRLAVHGKRCVVRIGKHAVVNCHIWLQGAGTVLEIGDRCTLNGGIHVVRGEGGIIRIGDRTTFNGVGMSMHEAGRIEIGEDCMFSTDVHMDVSDMHPIYDRATGERVNPPRDIIIGNHVWIGTRVFLNKGARIGEGAVVGGGSMVVGEIPPHCLAVGTPARVVRENIEWRREFDEIVTPKPRTAPAPRPAPKRGWLDRLPRLGQNAKQ